jgi:ribonuclease R
MENHIGEEFDGRISGIIDRGIFVELVDSKCEGMVGFDTMSESYDVSEGRLQATGKRTGDILKMGDTIRVKVLDADLEKRRIEMALVEA